MRKKIRNKRKMPKNSLSHTKQWCNLKKSVSIIIISLILCILGILYFIDFFPNQTEIVHKTNSPYNVTTGIGISGSINYAMVIHSMGINPDRVWLAENADLIVVHDETENSKYIDIMKTINPDLKIFLYKFSGLSDTTNSAADLETVEKECPDCFLTDNQNNKIYDIKSYQGKKDAYLMDWSHSYWREVSCNSMLNTSIRYGFDGIYIDVVNSNIDESWLLDGINQYSTNDEYNEAVLNYLNGCKELFKNEDKELIINGVEFISTGIWNQLLLCTDGAQDQGFANRCCWREEDVYMDADEWDLQIQAMEEAGRQDKIYIATYHVCKDSRTELIYGIASYLLGKSNENSYFMITECKTDFDDAFNTYNQYSEYLDIDLGKALGERYANQKIQIREFENGIVAVNPTDKTIIYSMDKKYVDLKENKLTDNIKLYPHTASILQKT